MNNNTIVNNNYGELKYLILLFKILMGTRKNFLEIHRHFGHTASKTLASPALNN